MNTPAPPETPAVLLYGYAAPAAERIATALRGTLPPFRLLSAAGRKTDPVGDILASGGAAAFEESPVKVLLLAGFADEEIHAAVGAFPRDPALPRPLFCALTPTNRAWTFETLVRHLFAERASFRSGR